MYGWLFARVQAGRKLAGSLDVGTDSPQLKRLSNQVLCLWFISYDELSLLNISDSLALFLLWYQPPLFNLLTCSRFIAKKGIFQKTKNGKVMTTHFSSRERRWCSNELQSDLFLVCSDGRVAAHTALLADLSKFFADLLASRNYIYISNKELLFWVKKF